MALLSVIGPEAPRGRAAEHENARVEVGGATVVAVTHGRGPGPLLSAEDRDAVRAALRFPDGDEAAAEVVRVESGRPRYGVDLDDSVIPQEAGLNERAVSFTKGCYVGQETVARLLLPGQAEPAPAGPEAERAGGARDRVAARREGRRQARLGGRVARARTDRRWHSCGAKRTRATRWPDGHSSHRGSPVRAVTF